MGSGLFMASGIATKYAGPSIIVLFAIGAVAMYLEINVLAEMSIANPSPGSFLNPARIVLGPGWTFVAGWIFWFSSVLTMSSEVTAAALFTRFWFPGIALWIWSLAYSILIVGINFISVRGFGTVEDLMAGIKTIAVFAFVGALSLTIFGVIPRSPMINPLTHATRYGGFFPHGVIGAAPAMLLVLFAYAGTGVVGLAAAEAKDPKKTIKSAIHISTLLVVVMYLGSIWAITSLVPWTKMSDITSPFILALKASHLPYGSFIMNFVLLFAVLSTMNAALYSNVRVLYTLSHKGDAPKALGKLNKKGLPIHATWTSASLLGATIILAYILPHKAYAYLVTATGVQAMFIWFIVLLTQLYYRPYLIKHHPDRLIYKAWGYPFSTISVIGLIILALIAAPLAKGELWGVVIGFAGILVAWIVWIIVRPKILQRKTT